MFEFSASSGLLGLAVSSFVSATLLPGTSEIVLLAVLQQHPEQWLWGYKHWRYRPANPEKPHPFYANRSELFDAEFENAN